VTDGGFYLFIYLFLFFCTVSNLPYDQNRVSPSVSLPFLASPPRSDRGRVEGQGNVVVVSVVFGGGAPPPALPAPDRREWSRAARRAHQGGGPHGAPLHSWRRKQDLRARRGRGGRRKLRRRRGGGGGDAAGAPAAALWVRRAVQKGRGLLLAQNGLPASCHLRLLPGLPAPYLRRFRREYLSRHLESPLSMHPSPSSP